MRNTNLLEVEFFFEVGGDFGDGGEGDFFGSANGCDAATVGTCIGSYIYNVVCVCDDIEVVFDDDEGVFLVHEGVEYGENLLDVVKV